MAFAKLIMRTITAISFWAIKCPMETDVIIKQALSWDKLTEADRQAVIKAFSLLKRWRDESLEKKGLVQAQRVGDGLELELDGNKTEPRIY